MAPSRIEHDLLLLTYPSECLTHEEKEAVDPLLHPEIKGIKVPFEPETIRKGLLLAMRIKEDSFARKKYSEALGLPDPHPNRPEKDLVDSLAADYTFFGISTGRWHAEQLLRDFGETAVERARSGPSPG